MNPLGLNRRSVLKGLAFSSMSISTGLPVLARESFPKIIAAPSDFLKASSALIGVDIADLEPTIAQDDYSLADEYYSLAQDGAAQGLSDMLILVQTNPALPLQDLGNLLLRQREGDPTGGFRRDSVGTVARLTLQMWLFGIWYGFTEVDRNPASSTTIDVDYQKDFVLSSRAYKSGWIWRFAQAHPMGFSQFGFGQWHDQPPPLKDYMPNTTI